MIDTFGTIGISVIAIVITWFYAWKAKKGSDDQIFYQLYSSFNERYDKINEKLHRIKQTSEIEYTLVQLEANPEDYKVIIDYFNICAEEYFWYKKRRIDANLWTAWHYGMNKWYREIPVLRELWKKEISGDNYKSYYLKKGDNLFDEIKFLSTNTTCR